MKVCGEQDYRNLKRILAYSFSVVFKIVLALTFTVRKEKSCISIIFIKDSEVIQFLVFLGITCFANRGKKTPFLNYCKTLLLWVIFSDIIEKI